MRLSAAVLAVATALPPGPAAPRAVVGTVAAGGQERSTPAAAPPATQPPAAGGGQTAYLGVSLARIHRDLADRPASPTPASGLRYDFHVDVFGEKPPIDFFEGFDLGRGGAVRYGGMTHAEFVDLVTPQAFKAPAAGLMSLALLAIQGVAKLTIDTEAKKRKQKEKDEAALAEQREKEHPTRKKPDENR